MPRIIVRRDCADTFQQLQEAFADDAGVEVLWDRRAAERRTRPQRTGVTNAAPDRRGPDRRKRPSQTWLMLDFVVVGD